MHLAYVDDSDTKAKNVKWQVMSAVLIEDKSFKLAEIGVSIVPEELMPAGRIDEFQEFHACELYGGHGVFAGIDQEIRFQAIERLLATINMLDMPVIYGAVDLPRLQQECYASADPVDIGFRTCVKGIMEWADAHVQLKLSKQLGEKVENYTLEKMTPHLVSGILEELVILITDECDKAIRHTLQKSFRELRPAYRASNQMNYLHDDMYFGDSRYSIGIQLADLCSYFIARHLSGDVEVEGFYNMIEPNIVYSLIHPPLPTSDKAELAVDVDPPKEIPDEK